MKVPQTFHLRVLHISDLHERGEREQRRFGRNRTLCEQWDRNVSELQKDGSIDLVCMTGDIADWGRADEYKSAVPFFTRLLDQINVPVERFFIVPGNHDIDRTVAIDDWKAIRARLEQSGSEIAFSRWIRGHKSAPFGLTNAQREGIRQRQDSFRQCVSTLGRGNLLPENSPHGTLGFRESISLPELPFPIHMIGLDSSWLCGDENDAGRLALTSDQVGALCSDSSTGTPLDGFRLAMIHHPLEWLRDVSICQPLLADGIDLLLRGHVHTESFQTVIEPGSQLPIVAAGCLYEGDEEDHWPNAHHVIDIELDEKGRLISLSFRFRTWSPKGFWYDDNGIYKGATNGRLRTQVPLRRGTEALDASSTAKIALRSHIVSSILDRLRTEKVPSNATSDVDPVSPFSD